MAFDNLKIIQQLLKLDLDEYQNLSDLFAMLKHYEPEGFEFAHKLNRKVRSVANRQARNECLEDEITVKFNELYKQSLLFDAPHYFEPYLIYLEYDRPIKDKFYVPRMNPLQIVVQDLQDLYDKKIKLLAISLPPRVGKSTIGILFITWLIGKHPEKTNLMLGYGDKLAKGFYKEVQSIIESDDYLWHDIFPDAQIKAKSAEDLTLDINKNSRYPTLTCRSIEGQLTGIADVKSLLYCDDLIEGIEEALNPNRMESKYGKYVGVVKDRKGDNVPELHIGTRWNVNDVIGKLKEQYDGDPRYRFRVIPALNESDESNFYYDKGRNPEWDKIGFSTEHYLDMRKTHEMAEDIATWDAKYQGEPYVREGLVFPNASILTFNGVKELPDSECIKYIACDVAWGGGDSLSAPVGYVYGSDVYIVDWLFSKGDKDETRPRMKAKIMYHKPHYTRFEANNGGQMYCEDIENQLRKDGYRYNIETVMTTGGKNASKHAEILAYAPDIRRWHFLSREYQDDDYRRAMKELCQYTQNGKAKHDDAPDGLKQLAKMILEGTATYEISERLW